MDRELLHKVAQLHPTEVLQPFDTLLQTAGLDAVVEFAQQLEGEQLYVPSVRKIFARCLEIEARKEFTGDNYGHLAKKYGYTGRHIRRLFGG